MIKLTNDFRALIAVREKLGAEVSSWRPGEALLDDRTEIRLQLVSGIELALNEIEVVDGLFAHKGEQVVIYIKDNTYRSRPDARRKRDVRKDPGDGTRVHLRECSTIVKMREQKKFDKYVATNRRDNLYSVDVYDDAGSSVEERDLALRTCKNCLKELNFNEFLDLKKLERNEVWLAFDIVEFFECYSTLFSNRPKYTDETAPISMYIDGWSQLSSRIRDAANWKCAHCDADLSAKNTRRWLHVHHMNGQKGDNNPSNLVALCVLCHAKQPGHGHMFIDPAARDTITRLRRELHK
jgi:hypothetical protein